MLTLNHAAEQQTAILAVCPRPRALALIAPAVPSTLSWRLSATPSAVVLAAPALAAAVSAGSGLGSAAAVRPLAAERPVAYGRRRGEMAGFGFTTASPAGAGAVSGTIQQDQNKQNLTDRREPRTWRPPH
jgi:hypothetical protein